MLVKMYSSEGGGGEKSGKTKRKERTNDVIPKKDEKCQQSN